MRRCSHCSNNGHNSRTCPHRGVKIFGVRLTDGSIRKSASMGNLTLYGGGCGGGGGGDGVEHGERGDGYASEDLGNGASGAGRERKKGVPWTEEEHRMFLLGLKKLGKGDWRGIARNYVVSRTPTQVASHAQKYFIRQTNASRRKRRTSLFDIAPEPVDAQLFTMGSQEEIHDTNSLPAQLFTVGSQEEILDNNPLPPRPILDEECESMDSNSNDGDAQKPESVPCSYPVLYPAIMAPFYPYPFPFWPGYGAEAVEPNVHEVVKPTAIHLKAPTNVEPELGSMSNLSLADSISENQPLFLSLKLQDGSKRHSAFHAQPRSASRLNSSSSASRVNSSSSAIRAV